MEDEMNISLRAAAAVAKLTEDNEHLTIHEFGTYG